MKIIRKRITAPTTKYISLETLLPIPNLKSLLASPIKPVTNKYEQISVKIMLAALYLKYRLMYVLKLNFKNKK